MGVQFSANQGTVQPAAADSRRPMLTAMQSKYGGLMAAQSATFDGMLSNLRDWAGATLRETGKTLFDVLRTQLANLMTLLNSPAVTGPLAHYIRSGEHG